MCYAISLCLCVMVIISKAPIEWCIVLLLLSPKILQTILMN